MEKHITITKKTHKKGDDGYKVFSVRIQEETIAKLDALSRETNRSRNELVNILLTSALKIVDVK